MNKPATKLPMVLWEAKPKAAPPIGRRGENPLWLQASNPGDCGDGEQQNNNA